MNNERTWHTNRIILSDHRIGSAYHWQGVAETPGDLTCRYAALICLYIHPDGREERSVVGPVVDLDGTVVDWFPRVAGLRSTPRLDVELLKRLDYESARREERYAAALGRKPRYRPSLAGQWDAFAREHFPARRAELTAAMVESWT